MQEMIAIARKAIEQRKLIDLLPPCKFADYKGDLVKQPCANPHITYTETSANFESGELSLPFFLHYSVFRF